jgi:hypothetical protein
MFMKRTKFFPSLMMITAVVMTMLFAGCKKNDSAPAETADGFQADEQDVAQSEDLNTSFDNMAAEVGLTGGINERRDFLNSELGCASVTRDTVNHVDTLFFNHCTGRNGHILDGYIIIQRHDGGNGYGYWDVNASWDMTFNQFYIDSRNISGTRHVVNNGPVGNGMTWAIDANLRITRPDSSYRTWVSSRTRELVQGYKDSVITNHIYKINGTASTYNSRNGNSASITITNVIRNLSCAWLTSGTITVAPSNHRTRVIDFGNGICDYYATVTVGNKVRTIVLRP